MHLCQALPCVGALAFTAFVGAQHKAQADKQVFEVGDAIVRIGYDDGESGTSVSRDRGQSFKSLPAADNRIYLRCGVFDPLEHAPPTPGALAAPAHGRLFVVQSRTSILPEYRQVILDAGLEVIAYWPMNAYVVRGDRSVMAALMTLPWVRWVGDVAVGYKLEEQLVGLLASLPGTASQPVEYNIVLSKKGDRPALAARIAILGGVVTDICEDSIYLRASLDAHRLAQVAELDSVLWIDVATPVEHDMDNARLQGGGDYIESQGGFTGNGVRAEILEGLEESNPDWTLPPLLRFDATSSHGHCTGAIVAGNGSGNAAARGMMPDSQIIESSVDAWTVSRYTLTQDSVNPALPWQSMQQTASWGNGRTFLYTSISADLDDALFDADIIVTQSQSNSGTRDSRPQAWAKNVIACGGVNHANNSTALDDFWGGASIGPASDGRIKPDITAYYDQILCGDQTGNAGYTSTNYTSGFGGTSGSTPMVNGHIGLMQEMYTDGLFGNPLPLPATPNNRFHNRSHMTTMKALLCNTAASYAFSGAGHNLARVHQGWGFPDLRRVYDNRDGMVLLDEYDGLSQGQARSYLVWVRPGTSEFRATMVYADPPGVPNSAIHRINSVDLSVTRLTDGTVWWGNNGLDTGNASSPGGSANDRDTVENVWLPSPASDVYTVTVSAPTIVQDGHIETTQLDVDFALAMHPMGGGYHSMSGIVLDLVSTAPGDVRVNLANMPTSGWTSGFTFFSWDTLRHAGFGSFFGLEADPLTSGILGVPATAGDVFHFTNTPGNYPFATYTFPPALALALSGWDLDGIVMLFNGGQIAELSNVDRLTIQ